jgi:Uma2 family endonuclease
VALIARYTRPVRAIFLEVPEGFLAERERLGHDRKDEMWEGVLHMVPPASGIHERVAHGLLFALKPIADRLGLMTRAGTTGLFGSEKNYRLPDVTLAREDQESERGLESAELVVEVLSPYDESRDKFPFFAQLGIREVWLVDPNSRAFELYVLTRGAYIRRLPDDDGRVTSPVLGVTLVVVDGPRLQLDDGTAVALI